MRDEIDDDRLAADILAEREREPARRVSWKSGDSISSRSMHDFAPVVGQLDADGVAAGHDGDAGGDRAHRAGDVVGEADHARGLGAGRGLELVERDHRVRGGHW